MTVMWSPQRDALRGRVALVAGATRGAGRAIAALATDPARARWNQHSLTFAELARAYGFTDIDGSRPDSWAHQA